MFTITCVYAVPGWNALVDVFLSCDVDFVCFMSFCEAWHDFILPYISLLPDIWLNVEIMEAKYIFSSF